jgi:predicted O-methyltransferase YrrM
MTIDPFRLKEYPKWDPRRAIPTLYARLQEAYARTNFEAFKLSHHALSSTSLPEAPEFEDEDTAVTSIQMQHLQAAARYSLQVVSEGIAAVEVGCYRGVTTQILADTVAPNTLVAIDPFIGWGGADEDYSVFQSRIENLPNVQHERVTSGEAARDWRYGAIGFVFIDAVHDYWNTMHDLHAWSEHLSPGGLLAAHDTDQLRFAGTRRAVYEMSRKEIFEIFAHIDNLVILKKR